MISVNTLPSILYKYRSLRTEKDLERLMQIFNGKLYFNAPKEFNDPIDSVIPIDINLSKNEKDKFLKRVFDMIPGENRKARRHNKALYSKRFKNIDAQKIATATVELDYCLYSLSANCIDWLMWSYYADGHRGLVIGFDTKDFFPLNFIAKINYRDTIPTTKYSDEYMKRMESSLLTKPIVYAHEDEFRIIEYNEAAGLKKFSPTNIAEIIIGCKMSKESLDRLKAAIDTLPVRPKILKTVLPHIPGEKFELKLEEFTI